MILTDAGIFIADYRAKGADRKLAGMLATLPVTVIGPTRSEVLAGAKSPADRAGLLVTLNAYALYPIPERVWDAIGDNIAALRRAGVTVPLPDVILATVAIDAGLEVWTRDKHFTLMQHHLPALRLFVEPP